MAEPGTHRSTPSRSLGALVLCIGIGLVLAACGSDDLRDLEDASAVETTVDDDRDDPPQVSDDGPNIVVTTSILGDIVQNLVGDDGRVDVLMPPGTDPHGFQPSAADAASLRTADLVVANGLQLEENLAADLAAAQQEGVRVFTLADKLDPIAFDLDGSDGDGSDDHGHDDEDDHGHDDEDDHGHDDEDDHGHDDEDDHGHDDRGHGPDDPHVWLDPVRMADGVPMLAAEIAEVDASLDAAEWERRGQVSAEEILAVHEQLENTFARIPDANRQLITNHAALGYLAARYDFEVLGTVIPGASTQAEADPRSFADLIETVERARVPAVFAENTDATTLAEQLASEVIGRSDLDIAVVRIHTDALGDAGSGAESYVELLRSTAELITDALS